MLHAVTMVPSTMISIHAIDQLTAVTISKLLESEVIYCSVRLSRSVWLSFLKMDFLLSLILCFSGHIECKVQTVPNNDP